MSLKITIQQQPAQTKKFGRGRFDVEQHQRTKAIKTAQCKSKTFCRHYNRNYFGNIGKSSEI